MESSENAPAQSEKIATAQTETARPSNLNRLKVLYAKFMSERGGSKPKTEAQQTPGEKGEDYASQIAWPHGEIALRAFDKANPHQPEMHEVMEHIRDEFFNLTMKGTEIFTDENGVSLPLARVSIPELAHRLTGLPIPEQSDDSDTKYKKLGIFPSYPKIPLMPFPSSGHQFTFVEQAFKEALKYLPRAIDDLKAGRLTQDVETFTFGSPTNKIWGNVPPEYVEELRKDAYKTLSKTYANCELKKMIPKDPKIRARTAIVNMGHSMAASVAIGTTEELIDKGLATQDREVRKEKQIPFVQNIADAPVTLNKSRFRKPEIVIGFGLDSIYGSLSSQHVRKATMADGAFIASVAEALKKRGIEPNDSPEAIELKKQGLDAIMDAMYKSKLTVDASKVKVNIRRGLFDSTMPSLTFTPKYVARRTVEKTKKFLFLKKTPLNKNLTHGNSLDVENVNERGTNAREFAVGGTHAFPIGFRNRSEMRRWAKAVRRLLPENDNTPKSKMPQATA